MSYIKLYIFYLIDKYFLYNLKKNPVVLQIYLFQMKTNCLTAHY